MPEYQSGRNECPHCGARFSNRAALCEDYRNPEGSFGCPACGVFLTRSVNRPFRPISLLYIAAAVLASLAVARSAAELLDRLWLLQPVAVFLSVASSNLIFWIMHRPLGPSLEPVDDGSGSSSGGTAGIS